MRASIIVFTLGLLGTSPAALAQEAQTPVANANANPSANADAAQRSHRIYAGGSLGGGSYGASPAAVLGLDASYAWGTGDEEMQDVGGPTVMLGFYVGRAR